ncbi:MAG: EcsC family protein [Peptoclostridium sp.]|uniref:EcsC family protein n=1 Tax=Peptoclostridium sp. TaxID=1904860 RepID=UPI00139C8C65|nr:EcsC family protein [Peptoclostridium sp.]MZQ76046.1 EcsC family protein [Peptoclostridium sp.]
MEPRLIKKELERLAKKEKKLIDRDENKLLEASLTPVREAIEQKMPEKIKSSLDMAFFKGFELVFEKGSEYIEKTYNRNKKISHYDKNDAELERDKVKKSGRRHIKNLDKQANVSKLTNSSISAAEGAVLGLLGIGVPDIPLFIAVIMKTIHEIALSYGFDYKTDGEKVYVLLLICAAVSRGDLKKEYNNQIELLEIKIEEDAGADIDLQEQMKTAAGALSGAILVAKFIQGIPIIGIVGSAVNYSLVRRIGEFAAIKYKKRYLRRKNR